MELREIVAMALPALGGIIWLIRLEGRVNTHEKACEERQKRLDERHTVISEQLQHIVTKLDRLVETR